MRAALTVNSAQAVLILCFLALATTLPLLLLPVGQAAPFTTAASIVSLALFHTLTAAGVVGVLAALYWRARDRLQSDRTISWSLALTLPFLVLVLTGPAPGDSEAAVFAVLLAALAPLVMLSAMADRARQQRLAFRQGQQEMAGAVLEHSARGERARIARELHDIVAHHISMVSVQAETARLTTPGLPEVGARQLKVIGDTARSALMEMRQLLGVLRQDVDGDVSERAPQPTLDGLADLLDQAREATGSGTRLLLRGKPLPVDPSVQLVAYRIVQEALTNARRHAAGAAVDVELRYDAATLSLRIRDNGPGPNRYLSDTGHGLTGMRERAAAVGGSLTTGAAVGGGFFVEAMLPASGYQ